MTHPHVKRMSGAARVSDVSPASLKGILSAVFQAYPAQLWNKGGFTPHVNTLPGPGCGLLWNKGLSLAWKRAKRTAAKKTSHGLTDDNKAELSRSLSVPFSPMIFFRLLSLAGFVCITIVCVCISLYYFKGSSNFKS